VNRLKNSDYILNFLKFAFCLAYSTNLIQTFHTFILTTPQFWEVEEKCVIFLLIYFVHRVTTWQNLWDNVLDVVRSHMVPWFHISPELFVIAGIAGKISLLKIFYCLSSLYLNFQLSFCFNYLTVLCDTLTVFELNGLFIWIVLTTLKISWLFFTWRFLVHVFLLLFVFVFWY